jgi:hypothetical protein
VGYPARRVVSLGKGFGDHSTPNGEWLAPRRVSHVLALGIASRWRKVADRSSAQCAGGSNRRCRAEFGAANSFRYPQRSHRASGGRLRHQHAGYHRKIPVLRTLTAASAPSADGCAAAHGCGTPVRNRAR